MILQFITNYFWPEIWKITGQVMINEGKGPNCFCCWWITVKQMGCQKTNKPKKTDFEVKPKIRLSRSRWHDSVTGWSIHDTPTPLLHFPSPKFQYWPHPHLHPCQYVIFPNPNNYDIFYYIILFTILLFLLETGLNLKVVWYLFYHILYFVWFRYYLSWHSWPCLLFLSFWLV